MKPRKSRDDHPLLHTVEEATALLRRCPVRAWFWWFCGTGPFVCCLLHFWSDMSRAADAGSHLAESALYLGLSYVLMKVLQAVFGDHLLRILRGGESPAPLPWRARLRLVASQALIHCTTPWVLALAGAAVLPAGWVYAFYHNANLLAIPVLREGGRTRDIFKAALAQCYHRPGQNHGVMLVLLVFSALVWMNILIGTGMTLMLMKSFTGVDNVFSRNPWVLISTGVLAATMGVSYMIAGPFVKACYAIRCFYGLSRKSGEDIAVRFRAAANPALLVVAGLMLALCCAATGADAPPPARASAAQSVDPGVLDRSIQEVMRQDIFQWRMPRDARHAPPEQAGWFVSFVRDTARWMKSVLSDIGDFFGDVFKGKIKDWVRGLFEGRGSSRGGGGGTPWANTVQGVLYVLLGVLVVVLGVLLYRQWKRRPPPAEAESAAAPVIDLKSEHVVATQLAENEWLLLAQEKIHAGEYRLALRALFLASLAHLGDRRLIAVAKSKANGDYVRELAFRARERSELRRTFQEQTREFDRAWYGWHEVSRDLLDRFRENHQRIVSDGAA